MVRWSSNAAAPRLGSRAARPAATIAVVVLTALLAVGAVGVTTAEPAAAAPRTYGSEPIDDVIYWAGQYSAGGPLSRCASLSIGRLAAMMIVPTFTETGSSGSLAPAPMTLSRWDTQSALWAFGDKSTPYQGAFWHPGVGMWQFDSAGGWPLTAATAINSSTSAEQAAKTMATRFCASSSSDVTTKMRYAWGPWYYCATPTAGMPDCMAVFNDVFDGANMTVLRAAAVTRLGGMQPRTCRVAGIGTVPCHRVDPARAEGNTSWRAVGAGIPTPLTKPFYVFEAGGREYRYWLAADSGYAQTIAASKPVAADARTSLTWSVVSAANGLCDLDVAVGSCPVNNGGNGWSAWSAVSPAVIGDPALALNADGRMEAVFVGEDGRVRHVWQTAPNGGWSGAALLGTSGSVASVELARDAAGRLQAFARTTAGNVFVIKQGPTDWGSWTLLGSGIVDLFDAATNADGRLELFGLDGAGRITHQWERPVVGGWSSWEVLGGPGVRTAASAINPDGRMELFGVTAAGALVHSWQIIGVGWSGWAAFAGDYAGKPSVALRTDRLMELFVPGADGGLYNLTQRPTEATGWTGFRRLGTQNIATNPAGARNKDGRMEAFAGLSSSVVGNIWQTTPNGSWSQFGVLAELSPAAITPGANLDGRLVLFFRLQGGPLLVAEQRQ